MSNLVKDPLNIIISGVGGQGNILASELVASALVEKGFYTTVGETYGASQRGGSVMSHVRVSEKKQYGPLIPRGEADIIVGFEPIETLRIAREYANKATQVIVNTWPNYPIGVLCGEAVYPEMSAIQKELEYLCGKVTVIEATNLAQELGNSQATNIVLVGSLAAWDGMPLTLNDYDQVLSQRFKPKVLELNRQAFSVGYNKML
ncbi:MAG: indolepyruvate oxidoreductase subunit beta [Chitinophagales bacterium]